MKTNFRKMFFYVRAVLFLALIFPGLLLSTASVAAESPIPATDHTPTAPLSAPGSTAQPRYISGFGLDNSYTIFYEDRNDSASCASGSYRIYFDQTTTGPLGFAAVGTATNICDSHFTVKDWPITVTIGLNPPTLYSYRAWGAGGNYPGAHNFYVSNDLVNWTLVTTFTFDHPSDGILYGFHDIIQLNDHYIGWVESAGGNTYIASSDNGDGTWTVGAQVGGATPSAASLLSLYFFPGITGPKPSGNFVLMELDGQLTYAKMYLAGDYSGIYLAINRAAAQAATPANAETAFMDPANWTWRSNHTGLPTSADTVIATTKGSGGHDVREAWMMPMSDYHSNHGILYTADYASGAKGLGWAAPAEPPCTTDCYVATTGSDMASGSSSSPFLTIQKGIDTVSPGGTVHVAAGTYPENVVINKHLTLSGAGVDTIILPPLKPLGTGYGIEIMKEGNGPSASDHTIIKDLRVTGGYNGVQFHWYETGYPDVTDFISHITLQNLQSDHNIVDPADYGNNEGDGVHFSKYTNYSDILIDHVTATDNAGFGIESGSGVHSMADLTIAGGYFAHNAYPGLEITTISANNITVNGNAIFENNGIGKDTEGDIVFTGSNGNISITDVTITSSGAETGLRISGGSLAPAGAITLTNLTINGTQATCAPNNPWGPYPSAAIVLSRFTDVSNVHFTNVTLNSTAPVGLFLGTITAPTLDLTGIRFNGMYGQLITLGRHGNNPAYSKANVNVDARNATFTGMTDNCAIEDKITHKLDDAELGLVTWVTDNVFVTFLSGSIQRGINAATAGNTVNVCPGTYDPQVDIAVPGWGGTYPAQGIVVWKNNLTIRAVNPDPSKTIIQNTLGAWMDWWRIQYLTGGVFTSSTPTLAGGFNPGTSASPNAIMIVASGVTIDGFTIHAHVATPSSGYNGSGILIGGVAPGDPNSLGADNNTVKNCVFSDVWQAVYIWHSSGNDILNNRVEALGNTGHWAGISIYDGYISEQINLGYPSKNNVIRGNTLVDKGISIGAWQPPIPTDNSGTKVVGNLVTGNIAFYYTASSGVEINYNVLPGQIIIDTSSTCTSCTVNNNTGLAGTGNGIQLFNMTGGTISGNTVSGRTANGIALLNSSGVAITGNTTTDNGGSGIVLAGTSNVTVAENLIFHNTLVPSNANPGGLTLKAGASSTTVINNTINNNTKFGVWIGIDKPSTGNVFHLNNIVANGVGMLNNQTTVVVDAEDNWWGTPTGPYNATSNTTGTGNSADDASDFNPWITGLAYTGDTVFPDSAVVLQAKLVNSAGNGLPAPVPGVSVEFFANGISQGVVTTDANGVAEITVNLPAGVNNIRVVVTGGGLLGDCLAGSETTASVVVNAHVDLAVVKSSSVYSLVGDPITYTYAVTNAGPASAAPTLTDDKCGTPAYVGGDDGDGLMNPGETWSFTCTYTPTWNLYMELTNTATVGLANTSLVDSNLANNTDTYTLYWAVLRKDVLLYWEGHNVDYSDPDTAFTFVMSKDGVPNPLGTFTIKESAPVYFWLSEGTYRFVEQGLPAGYEAAREGWWWKAEPGARLDMSLENVIHFDLAVTKTGPASAYPGEVITYSYTVTNTGPAAVTPVLSDDLLGTPAPVLRADGIHNIGDTDNDSKIDAGEVWQYTATYTVPTSATPGTNIVNVVTVKDAADDYGNEWKLGGDTNLANNTDDWSVTVNAIPAPALSLIKAATPATYDHVGQTINYSYVVKNTGNVTLAGPVTVADDKATVTCPAGELAPGASMTCTASYTIKQSDLDSGSVKNTAKASANGTNSNTAIVTVTADQKPALSLIKSASPATYDHVGQTISYSYVVKNTGNVTLAGPVTVADDKATVTCPAGGLAPGASMTCTASYTIAQADLDSGSVKNNAKASANGTDSNTASVTVTADKPALSLVKAATPATYDHVGQTINYSYVVKNTGNVTLAGPVTVADDKATVTCPAVPVGGLVPGDSITCTASYSIGQADLDSGSVKNTAKASANGTDSNTASVTVTADQKPALSLIKSASPTTYSAVGQVITYSYVVKNTGNVTLPGPFTISDNKLGTIICPLGSLAPGASVTCAATYTIKQSDLDNCSITNKATASTTYGGNEVKSNEATATVTAVKNPAISLTKSASPATYSAVGQVITYSYVVKNTGNVTLPGPFTISDNKLGTIMCPSGSLAPGTSVTCSATYTIKQTDQCAGSVTNKATASGSGAKSNQATATVTYKVVDTTPPDTKITSSPSNPSYSNSATFTFNGTDNVTPSGSLTFECKLDSGAWTACTSPKTYSSLASGSHTFSVRAKDAAGNVDATPASYTWKISVNQPPVAEAGGPYSGNEGSSITLDGSKSTDPDNNIVRYDWDLDNDGLYDDASGVKPTVTFADNGVYTVRLKVTDAGGLSSTDSATVTIYNLPPVIIFFTITSNVRVGTMANTRVTFKDAGINDTFTAVWNWGDGTTSSGVISGYTVTGSHTYTKAGTYTVTITIMDDAGGVGKATKKVTVQPRR
jgi:uncharacterized repeat protein (TIGR01451 family)